MINLKTIEKKLESIETEINIREKELLNLKNDQKKAKTRFENLEKIRLAIIFLSEESKKEIIKHIEELVTSCLSSTFGSKYSFEIKSEDSRGQQEYHFYVNKEGLLLELRDDICGDSLLDICSIGTRISELIIDETIEPVFLFDEPFRNLRYDKKPFVKELIQELSREFNIQFLIITHDEFYMSMADNIINVGE